jgi:hypothetical protein
MKRLVIAHLAAAAVATGGMLVAAPANAADCSTLTNPVYFSGSSASAKLLQAVSKQLAAAGTPVTIVYQKADSCVGAGAIVNSSMVTNTAVYWAGTDGTETACTIPAAGIIPDVGVSDVFAETCGFAVGSTQKDYLGPVQVMTFVAPTGSSESSISAEAAYVALGFGGASYQVAPWTDPTFMFIRPNSSGTKNMIGTAIGLPVAKWKGTEKSGSGDVLAAVTASAEANKTIGILATDYADPNRSKGLKILAYQHKDQSCGYYPDSTSSSFDKRNVRDGRYAIWGSIHFLTSTSGGNPVNANAKTVLDIITGGGTTAQKQAFIDAATSVNDVPVCAMKVTRSSEVGTPIPFTPPESCGCYFEFKATGSAPASCKTCGDDSGCSGATPKCHYGYCEAQ